MTTDDKSQLPLVLHKEEEVAQKDEMRAQKELTLLRKRLHKDRKKAKQPLRVVGISAALIGVIVLIYMCFRFNWPLWVLISLLLMGIALLILLVRVGYTAQWTGLKDKTLWDWLQLLGVLAIPIVVAGATLLFSIQQANLDQQQREATLLQSYIDNIQDLLLNHNLLNSKPTDKVAILARARTLTALQGLDPRSKRVLLIFLYEAHLIGYYDDNTDKPQNSIIDLFDAFLYRADLSNADLNDADLSGAVLGDAILSGSFLEGADLSNANLYGADLSYAHLLDANLSYADLRGADLSGAVLSGANLDEARVTQQQLDQVYLCKDAILPPGLTCHHNQ